MPTSHHSGHDLTLANHHSDHAHQRFICASRVDAVSWAAGSASSPNYLPGVGPGAVSKWVSVEVSTQQICESLLLLWYGDGAGNTVEENSSVFSLIRMR